MKSVLLILFASFLPVSSNILAQSAFNPAEIAQKAMPSVVLIKGIGGEGNTRALALLFPQIGAFLHIVHIYMKGK